MFFIVNALVGVAGTLGGLTLATWAFFSDRSRQIPRCPRCWYLMIGATGLRCPECGHVVAEAGEQVSAVAKTDSSTVISTTTGAALEIEAGVLLTDTVASIFEMSGLVLTDTTGTPVGTVHNVSVTGARDFISGFVIITLPLVYDCQGYQISASQTSSTKKLLYDFGIKSRKKSLRLG